ncbi:MAG: hypothetical protein U9R60_11900 [Bacteroidota bacterium]|nr:hypothetical protein [Bacteroidota bacterium]
MAVNNIIPSSTIEKYHMQLPEGIIIEMVSTRPNIMLEVHNETTDHTLVYSYFSSNLLSQAPDTVWIDDDFDSSTDGWDSTKFTGIQDGINEVGPSQFCG